MADIVQVGHSYDGAKYTVSDLVKAPKRVPNLVRDLVKDQDISQWLLRPGPTAVGGSVVFEENLALYANNDSEIVAEFGEIPMTTSPMRTLITRATTKRGLGLKISKEMETRNDIGRVQDEIRMVRDRIIRTRENIFFNAIMNADVIDIYAGAARGTTTETPPGAGGWLGAASTVRSDIAEAMYQISTQAPEGAQDYEKLGFQADTMIIHPAIESAFIDSDEINRIFAGSPLASEQLRYTGKMPKKFMGLDVLKSWSCNVDQAIVCQRKYMGFISTEWPLSGSPMKYDDDTQTYRTNFSYRDLVAIDNPKSVCFINGINDEGPA
jgi:hypothetical protein